jgi:hypothetical protein
MNSRVITGVIGAVTLLFGIGGLVAPGWVMRHLGIAVAPSFPVNFVRGEVRAVYGGLFLVMGALTALAAFNPRAHRGRIFMIGLLWLGLAGGRLFGILADGSPGLIGWLSLIFEAVVGVLLLLGAQMADREVGPSAGTASPPA